MRESIADFGGCPFEYGSFSTGFSELLHNDKLVATIRVQHFLASALFELECARPYELQKRLRFESRAFRFLASINAGATICSWHAANRFKLSRQCAKFYSARQPARLRIKRTDSAVQGRPLRVGLSFTSN